MAWTKIPKENHPIFHAALPDDKRVTSIKMFGGLCGTVNGHMFAGLWDETIALRLTETDRKRVLAMEGGAPFDPMGRGKAMAEMVLMPKAVMKQRKRLHTWMQKAFDYTAALPPKKKKKKAAKKAAKKSGKKKVAKKSGKRKSTK